MDQVDPNDEAVGEKRGMRKSRGRNKGNGAALLSDDDNNENNPSVESSPVQETRKRRGKGKKEAAEEDKEGTVVVIEEDQSGSGTAAAASSSKRAKDEPKKATFEKIEGSEFTDEEDDGTDDEEDADEENDALDTGRRSRRKPKKPKKESIRLIDPKMHSRKVDREKLLSQFGEWRNCHLTAPSLASTVASAAASAAFAATASVVTSPTSGNGPSNEEFATPSVRSPPQITSPSASVAQEDSWIASKQSLLASEPTHWIDIKNPREETMEVLQLLFDIHPLTVEDVLETNETTQARQKHEMFRHYRFVTYTDVHYLSGSNILTTVDLHIIVLCNVVITCHIGNVQSIDTVISRIRKKHKGHSPTTDWILYALLDSVSDLFFHLVEQLVMEVHTLDELVLILTAGEQSDFLRRIGIARKRAAFLRTQMIKKRDILHSLVLSDTAITAESNIYTIKLPREIKIYLRDVLDNIYTMFDETEAARETLGNLNNTYLARVSIEVAEASNGMNVVMKKFNAMATIVLPMTVITGMWGMNVPVPGQSGVTEPPNLSWFFGITAGLVFFAIVAVILFKKIKWL